MPDPSPTDSSKSANMTSTDRKSAFKKIQTFPTDWSSEIVTQYESQRTGMQAVVIDHKGPQVKGYFVLATEIHDDSGARKWINGGEGSLALTR